MKFSDLLSIVQKNSGTKKSHMKNLIEMAAADGNFMDIEYELLKSIAKDHGISESRLKEIRENPEQVKFEVPKDKNEKFRQLYDLVQMMSIDNDVHPKEMEVCSLFAAHFGYPGQHIKELIEIIRANIKNGQNVEETHKRVSLLIN